MSDREAAGRSALAPGERWALLGLAAVGSITAAWWALALWPAPETPAAWLARARSVCFNAGPDGLPDASGWILLIGQPIGMLGFLMLVWPAEVRGGLGKLAARSVGRAALGLVTALVLAGISGASWRVAEASRAGVPSFPSAIAAADHPRLDRPAPELELVNQRGERVNLATLAGRPALVTFAFGHCADICPAVVRGAGRARDASGGASGAALVVVTLDPRRDTPARLPDLARRWKLGPVDHLLGGSVEEVEAVLDAWHVPRARDPTTGEISHAPLVYVLDRSGRIAFASTAGPEALAALLGRL